jgi:hypothetical protein
MLRKKIKDILPVLEELLILQSNANTETDVYHTV